MIETILSHVDPTTIAGKLLLLAIVAGLTSVVQRVAVRIVRGTLEAAEVPQASIFVNVLRGLIWSFALLFVLALLAASAVGVRITLAGWRFYPRMTGTASPVLLVPYVLLALLPAALVAIDDLRWRIRS